MEAKLVLELDDELLTMLQSAGTVQVRLVSPESTGTPRAPREGSLPARVLEWASARDEPFTTAAIAKRFKLTRAHASMVLSRLASGPLPIERTSRGVYEYTGAAAGKPRRSRRRKVTKRK